MNLKDNNEILEQIMFNLKELNKETCSMKIPYCKEWEEYEKKKKELYDKEMYGILSSEESVEAQMKLIDGNIHVIEENRNEKEKIRVYQTECRKRLCRLLVDYLNENNPSFIDQGNQRRGM